MRVGDMARLESSDQTAINDRDEDATWQHVGRPIARAISAVDLHLNRWAYVAKSGTLDVSNLHR